MLAILVLTHGNLANELVTAAREIDSQLGKGIGALALPWDVDSDEATRLLKGAVREMDSGEGVIILTDMFGGTATNIALPLMEADGTEVVTGVNLPMLVKIGSLWNKKGIGPGEFALQLRDAGQKSIRVASEFLRR